MEIKVIAIFKNIIYSGYSKNAVLAWQFSLFKSVKFFLLSSFRVVSHSGPQTYMLLYFRSKEDSCSWGHPTYTMRALPYVGLPISGGCEPPHHHESCASESPSTARPLDLSLRVVRFPAPGALQEHNDAPAIYLECVKGDTDVKARGSWSPSEARQPPHHCAPAPFQSPLTTPMAGNGVFLSTPTNRIIGQSIKYRISYFHRMLFFLGVGSWDLTNFGETRSR